MTVPGPPASVLSAILRANPAYPYDPSDPSQRRMGWFSPYNEPTLPSLITDGVSLPAFASLPANIQIGGWLSSQGWGTQGVTKVTAAYTPSPADAVILCDATNGAFTITLPDATQAGFINPGQRYTVKKTDTSANVVTLAASAGQLIDGATTQPITPAQSAISVVFSGAGWEVTDGGSAIGTNAISGVVVSGTPATGDVLTATGPGTADWQTSASGVLTTLGDTLYEGSTGPARLAGNTTTTKNFYTQTGTGTASAAPAWGGIATTDLPAGSPGQTLTTSAAGAVEWAAPPANLPVQEATAAALPANTYSAGVLTATANGALTVDGVAVATGDRVLVKNEATAANNGLYTVTDPGSGTAPYVLTRAVDMTTGSQVPGAHVWAESGTINAGQGFMVASAGPFTIGTTAITWTWTTPGPIYAAGQDGYENMVIGSIPASIVPGPFSTPAAQWNVGFGTHNVLSALTTGYQNTAIGAWSLQATTSGFQNTALGEGSAIHNTTGYGNVAVGANALFACVTGHNNTALGTSTLGACTSSNNVAVGTAALNALTTGTTHVAVGTNALQTVTTNSGDTAVGYRALVSATAGNATAVGTNALAAMTSGNQNTGVGNAVLTQVTTGGGNTAIGFRAGYNIVTGTNNTIVGDNAGYTDGTNTTTDNSGMTLIGQNAQATTGNVIVLGQAIATRPNMIFGDVGAAAAFGGGVGVFAVANAVTAPTASYAGGGILYASAGALLWRGSSGTVTTIASA